MTLRSKLNTELPNRLGRYILLTRLTEGGMTEVYAAKLAEEVGPGRILVIKRLPLTAAADPSAEMRFLEEARIVLNLTHGNITTAFEFGRDEADHPFLVMEYVPGPSLRRLCAATAEQGSLLSVPDALFVAGEVCKALSYAHGFAPSKDGPLGIIHRDISPDNIVLSTSGQVKLTDFGIAELVQSRAAHPLMGKPAYIAPEIAVGGAPTVASDLYSLGAVLYECLTGAPPFKGKSDKETLVLSATQTPPPPSSLRREIDENLDALVGELLQKDPKNRPISAAAVEVRIRSLSSRLVPAYTEADLAATINRCFSPEAFNLSETREAIRAALLRDGAALSGSETTGDLLEGGTIPLTPTTSETERRSASKPSTAVRRSHRRKVALFVGLPLGAVAAAAAFFLLRVGNTTADPPPVSVSPPRSTKPAVSAPPTESISATPPAAEQTEAVSDPEEKDTTPGPGIRKPIHQKPPSDTPKRAAAPSGGKKPSNPVPTKTDAEAAAFGWLNINSYPWSYVTVDGERLTGHTPYRKIKLKAGPHTLAFENPELGLKTRRTVIVTAWEESNIGVRLKSD